ncbi:MAG: DEAD/DEAH box helicase [Gaiellaceae bacterium]
MQRRLATIPVEGLRDATEGRLRLGALKDAGYRTVADIASASRWELERVPSVGPQTASQALAAARQLETAIGDDMAIRLDPDLKGVAETELLASLRAFDEADRAISPIAEELADLQRELGRLADEAAPAGGRFRLLLAGRRRRGAAHEAVSRLEQVLSLPATTVLEAQLTSAEGVLASPVQDADALWRDYERRSPEYFGLLGEVGDLRLDLDAAQGFLPSEIAERVKEQQLDDSFLEVSLRGYQAFGAKFALVQRRTILGDEMGLGKTIEAIAALGHLRSLGATHFMVVCPASVLVNWTNELRKRSRLDAYRVHGSEREISLRAWTRRGGVAVTTYQTLGSLDLPEDGVSLAMLVADEAHYVKNPDAQRSKHLARWSAAADRVLFLTGTPMENRVEEFRTLVGYLQPEVAAKIRGVDGLAGADRFRKAVAPVYLRRNQTDVLTELPDRLEMEDWVEFAGDDLDAYRDAVESGNFMAMRRAAFVPTSRGGSAKLDRLLEIVEESADNGWKVVVFSYFRDVLAAVHHAIGDAAAGPITGSVKPEGRQEIVDEFTATEGHAVLISQIEAGGVGLNMQAASVVVLTEPQWKPTSEEQAIARCHRMGQVRRVHVHRLFAKDSVDQRMIEILEGKAALFEEYVGQSDLKDASPDAVDLSDLESARQVISDAEAERRIIEMERKRLGLPDLQNQDRE